MSSRKVLPHLRQTDTGKQTHVCRKEIARLLLIRFEFLLMLD